MGIAGFVNIFVPAVIIAAILVVYFMRGRAENSALESALRTLSGNEYAVIENPALHTDAGVVSVDYAIVSIYGVFLVVTSGFKGRVTGEETGAEWTLSGRKGTETIDNPLHRTAAFADALQQALPSYRYPLPVAIVAFPARDVLAVHSTQHVTYIAHVIDIIRSYDRVVLPFSQTAGMTAALRAADRNNGPDDQVLSDMM